MLPGLARGTRCLHATANLRHQLLEHIPVDRGIAVFCEPSCRSLNRIGGPFSGPGSNCDPKPLHSRGLPTAMREFPFPGWRSDVPAGPARGSEAAAANPLPLLLLRGLLLRVVRLLTDARLTHDDLAATFLLLLLWGDR